MPQPPLHHYHSCYQQQQRHKHQRQRQQEQRKGEDKDCGGVGMRKWRWKLKWEERSGRRDRDILRFVHKKNQFTTYWRCPRSPGLSGSTDIVASIVMDLVTLLTKRANPPRMIAFKGLLMTSMIVECSSARSIVVREERRDKLTFNFNRRRYWQTNAHGFTDIQNWEWNILCTGWPDTQTLVMQKRYINL